MNEFIEALRTVYPLSDTSIDILLSHAEVISMKKGELVITEHQGGKNAYFIVKGLARGYVIQNGKDSTLWFASIGMTLLSMNAYLFTREGYENIELLEDAELLRIPVAMLNHLFETNLELCNWGRRMADHIIHRMELHFMRRNFMSASQRYHFFVTDEPELLKKVPLRHIASYLGVSQVSLSRIRAGIQ